MKHHLFLLLLCLLAMASCAFAQTIHYLDCEGGDDARDSLRPDSAWKTLARASSYTYQPGDSLLLRRGSVCAGLLWPKGSGSEGKPITLGAYGVGDLPRIVGAGQEAGLKLHDQQYWIIKDLDITGGDHFGIIIGGAAPKLSHFRLSDLVVHDVTGEPKTKNSGMVVIVPDDHANTLFSDIVIDGITAYGTTQWAGIIINGADYSNGSGRMRGPDITVRNSIVHDVAGDGILLACVKNGLIERNVSWNTGMQYTESIGTPSAIWEWMCEDCVVQYNEGFFSDSPGVDGGVFDIDYGNINNTVQYNFAHDSQGYCASIFGAEGVPGYSLNSTIRRNLCVNNGRSPRLAKRQGAIYLCTWDGGKLGGVQIYSNTIYWDPALDTAAIVNEADIDPGAARVFRDNLIVSTVSTLLRSNSDLDLSDNLYWTLARTMSSWVYGGIDFSSLASFQSSTGQERHSHFMNPRLGQYFEPKALPDDCNLGLPATEDLFGNAAAEGICAPGAVGKSLRNVSPGQIIPTLPLLADGIPYSPSGWTLLALLTPEGHTDADLSRSQLVVLQSMLQQFSTLSLNVDVAPTVMLTREDATNWRSDWDFGRIRLLASSEPLTSRGLLRINKSIGMVLISPDKHIVRTWSGLTSFPEVELTLRALLGTPRGMQVLAVEP
jgi:hypothetical protein